MQTEVITPELKPDTLADTPAPVAPPKPARLASIDAYRGLVMFLMMAEVLHLGTVAKLTGNATWKFLAYHQSHVEWIGCSLHDLIQPSFSFLVGVALPFSIASRRGRGQSALRMTLHAFWRALLLICLGFFLRSQGKSQTEFTFEDTLTQIGLGFGFLFLLGLTTARAQWLALGLLLVGYWAVFAIYPRLPADFAYGVAPAWQREHGLTGFAAHWNKNLNLAWEFDTWFLNLFPRTRAFSANTGGYATLSFIPTLATMILGLLAGNVLKGDRRTHVKLAWFAVAGGVGLGVGWLLGVSGVCPVVKRIWTPSWVLFSGGWCFLFLAAFYLLVDLARLRPVAFPLIVIGANSIAAYFIAHTWEKYIGEALTRHLPTTTFTRYGAPYEQFALGVGILLVFWLFLLWMYRRKLFLRI